MLIDDTGASIGVQVKRYSNKIEAEQIRAFLGALTLAGHARGIFVTTSSYRKGSHSCVKRASEIGKPIELVDAGKFLELLKIAQIRDFERAEYPFGLFSRTTKYKLQPVAEYHLNSL